MAKFITNSIFEDEPLPFAAEGLAQGKLEDGLSAQYTQWKQKDTPQTRHGMLKAVQPIIDRTVASYGSHPYITGQAKKLALQALHWQYCTRGSGSLSLPLVMRQFPGP